MTSTAKTAVQMATAAVGSCQKISTSTAIPTTVASSDPPVASQPELPWLGLAAADLAGDVVSRSRQTVPDILRRTRVAAQKGCQGNQESDDEDKAHAGAQRYQQCLDQAFGRRRGDGIRRNRVQDVAPPDHKSQRQHRHRHCHCQTDAARRAPSPAPRGNGNGTHGADAPSATPILGRVDPVSGWLPWPGPVQATGTGRSARQLPGSSRRCPTPCWTRRVLTRAMISFVEIDTVPFWSILTAPPVLPVARLTSP